MARHQCDFKIYGYSYNLNISKQLWNCTRQIDIISPTLCLGEDEVDAVLFFSFPRSEYFPKSDSLVEFGFEEIKLGVPSFTEYELDPNNELQEIMKLMKKQNWEYVRVHFLCDLVAENREVFQEQLANARNSPDKIPLGLFDVVYEDDLDVIAFSFSLLPIINTWGDTQPLKNEAILQASYFPTSIGVKTEDGYQEFDGMKKKQSKLLLDELSQMVDTCFKTKELEEDTLVRIW